MSRVRNSWGARSAYYRRCRLTDLVKERLGVGYHGGHRNRGVKHHDAGAGVHSLAQKVLGTWRQYRS